MAKYDVYAGLRERRVQRSDRHGGFWILSHAADVEAASLDTATYSSQVGGVLLPQSPTRLAGLEHDPPEHTPYRKLYAKAINRPALRQAEPQIRKLASRIIGRFADAGGGDFVQEVGSVLPVETIALVIGLTPAAAQRVRELTEYAWANLSDPEAFTGLVQMVLGEVMDRRAKPREDFLTAISSAEMLGGREITDGDIAAILNGLIVAGHETTMNASANLALHLARDPELRARIVVDPALTPAVVDEILRFDSPVQDFFRVLTRDVVVDGIAMSAGDRVLLVYGAANRDPYAFSDPDAFDPDRTNLKHYSFGFGLHRCVGAILAQLELQILADELAPLEFSVVGEPLYGPPSGGGAFSGLTSLRLSFP